MATNHVTAEPVPGHYPDPRRCPVVPVDLMTENVGDAIGWGEAIIAEDAHHIWQSAYAAANPEPERDEDVGPLFDYPLGDTDAADQATAYVDQWQVVARLVDRPAVNLMPRGAVDPVIRHGVVVSYASPAGDGRFDVLIDGVASGYL